MDDRRQFTDYSIQSRSSTASTQLLLCVASTGTISPVWSGLAAISSQPATLEPTSPSLTQRQHQHSSHSSLISLVACMRARDDFFSFPP